MIQGLTAHYKKKGEYWKIIQSAKAPGDESAESKEESDPHRALVEKQLQRSAMYRHVLQCNHCVRTSEISYSIVSDVIASWQVLIATPNWEKEVGDLFLRYIFKIEPGTVELFGFPSDTDYKDPDLTKNKKFLTKGVVLIKAIDAAVHLLGPDLSPLEEILFDLGKRHVHMKAQPEFWPLVGEALFLVFEERLGQKFDDRMKESWTVMYNFLGYYMIEGLKYQYKKIKKGSTNQR